MAVPLFSAAAATVADGTPTTLAARTASPTRRPDVDDSASTTIAAKTIIPVRKETRWVGRSSGFMLISPTHETRREARDLSDEGIDETIVSIWPTVDRLWVGVSKQQNHALCCGVPSPERGAGGTPGGVVSFFIGLVMAAAGGYLILNQVQVTTAFPRWGPYGGFGLSLLPLLVGVALLFFNGRSIAGWILTAAGAAIILSNVLMHMDIYFQTTSL